MPIYPFRCDACAVEFEVTRKASAAAEPAACPACGGATRRIFTAIGRAGASSKGGDASGGTSGGWSHGGHAHAAGSAGHSHGPVNPLAP
ncbi:MAG: FmdB family zinc ribbon protein [Chloroflexota bacterium]